MMMHHPPRLATLHHAGWAALALACLAGALARRSSRARGSEEGLTRSSNAIAGSKDGETSAPISPTPPRADGVKRPSLERALLDALSARKVAGTLRVLPCELIPTTTVISRDAVVVD